MLPLLALLCAAHANPSTASTFSNTIGTVESMVWNGDAQTLVARHGLSLVNVTWEDTGRTKGSAWGPNISDMTIGVRDPSGALHPMPVIRFDNFTDTTADLRSDRFFLRVGNEDGKALAPVTLRDVLQETRAYLHDPRSWSGNVGSLWAERDANVLVSAQACFLPIPSEGEATFTPVIYNYASGPGAPAVLTIVATREGTSIQVVENDAGYMSEVLYFNEDGARAPFVAMRQSDFKARGGDATTRPSEIRDDAGLNVVLVIQVPLKVPERAASYWGYGVEDDFAPSMAAQGASARSRSDVENAVIGHGDTEGPFTEIHNLAIARDSRFPVRVTVQMYKATSNGVVTDEDVASIRREIDRIYSDGSYVGSLVTEGFTGRPTEWVTPPAETAVWAQPWWATWKAY